MHVARKLVLAIGAATILTGCSAGESVNPDPNEGYLLLEVRDHIEDEGREFLGGSGVAGSGPAGGRSEWSAPRQEVSLYAACQGSLGEGGFQLDGEDLDIACDEEGSVQLIESSYEPEGEVVVTNGGLEQGTEFAIAMASTAEGEN